MSDNAMNSTNDNRPRFACGPLTVIAETESHDEIGRDTTFSIFTTNRHACCVAEHVTTEDLDAMLRGLCNVTNTFNGFPVDRS